MVGVKDAYTGHTISSVNRPLILEDIKFPEPVVSVAIEPKTRADQDKLSQALAKFAIEDPTFKIRYDEDTAETIISGMGELHLEIIVDRLFREYNVQARVGKPQVAYKEAIATTSRAEGKYGINWRTWSVWPCCLVFLRLSQKKALYLRIKPKVALSQGNLFPPLKKGLNLHLKMALFLVFL